MNTRTTVAVAGASGFVGRAFCDRHRDDYELVGLTRSPRAPAPDRGPQRWRQCDLFSLLQVERALADVDVAIYLVHSMMPTDRLTQAKFSDLDLILADNFGRAAARAGVRKIIYLGGLIPGDDAQLSEHLESRLEVEAALGAYGVQVTTLRAGLIVGAQGSSFQILRKLVDRLPAMLCPRWTATKTHPIALADVVQLLHEVVRGDAFDGQTWDIAGPDVVTYREMIADVAALSDRRRVLVPAPLFSPRLSRLWVSLVTGTSRALVGPLVESLRHPMVAHDRALQRVLAHEGTPWRTALANALAEPTPVWTAPRKAPRSKTVRSVQRLARPPGAAASDVARAYLAWLPSFLWHWLAVRTDGDMARFYLRPWSRPLLELRLSTERSTADRTLLYVTGGALARPPRDGAPPGRLEFRLAPDGRSVIAAVHDFEPSLPWFLYVTTQARVHLVVMWAFDRFLRRSDSLPQTVAARSV